MWMIKYDKCFIWGFTIAEVHVYTHRSKKRNHTSNKYIKLSYSTTVHVYTLDVRIYYSISVHVHVHVYSSMILQYMCIYMYIQYYSISVHVHVHVYSIMILQYMCIYIYIQYYSISVHVQCTCIFHYHTTCVYWNTDQISISLYSYS